MRKKIESFLENLVSAIQAAKLYAHDHPQLIQSIDNAFAVLRDIFKEKNELVIGIVSNEIACENDIFFDLSQKMKSFIRILRDRGIEKIAFQKTLSHQNLKDFVSVLPLKQKQECEENSPPLDSIPNIRWGKIKTFEHTSEASEDVSEDIVSTYDNTLGSIAGTFDNILNVEEIDFLDLRFNILNVMDNYFGNHQELLNLVSVKQKDLITFVHLLNVSILSMYISSKLGFSREDTLDIGISALFHDIGKISISRKIIQKKSVLSEDEFTRMKDHALIGTQILLKYTDSLGVLPAVVALEHHIRYDRTGYPKLAFPRPPFIASLIVSMCDVYDALAQRRTYKKDYPPDKIYEIMHSERGKLFDPVLLDRFFRIMGVWPMGSIVNLSDGRVAVVRKPNPDDIHSPKIQILTPKGPQERIDLNEKGEALKIESALNPFRKGKKYLEYLEKKEIPESCPVEN